jgi:hypothetical protein
MFSWISNVIWKNALKDVYIHCEEAISTNSNSLKKDEKSKTKNINLNENTEENQLKRKQQLQNIEQSREMQLERQQQVDRLWKKVEVLQKEAKSRNETVSVAPIHKTASQLLKWM